MSGGGGDDDKTRFLKCFERLKEELVRDEIDLLDQVQIAVDWIREMIAYNVPHGKLNRGIAVMDGMRALNKDGVSDEDMESHGRRMGNRMAPSVLFGGG